MLGMSPGAAQAQLRRPKVQKVLGLFPEGVPLSSASVPCPSGQLGLSWALAATLGSCFGVVLPRPTTGKGWQMHSLSRVHPSFPSVLMSSAILSHSTDKLSSCDEQNPLHNQ